ARPGDERSVFVTAPRALPAPPAVSATATACPGRGRDGRVPFPSLLTPVLTLQIRKSVDGDGNRASGLRKPRPDAEALPGTCAYTLRRTWTSAIETGRRSTHSPRAPGACGPASIWLMRAPIACAVPATGFATPAR